MVDLRQKYYSARYGASTRGIPFRLTYEEYESLWLSHLERLDAGEKLCMCRTGDKGEYVLGNVRIDTVASNNLEALPNRKKNYLKSNKRAKVALYIDMEKAVNEFRKKLMQDALEKAHYNMRKASDLLGVTYRCIRHYCQKYNLK